MDGLISGEELLSLQFLMAATFGFLWVFLVAMALGTLPGRIGAALAHNQLIFKVLGIAALYLYPASWLNRALASRHREIQRSLPFVLDLLTLSVEAGMDFMSALQRSIEQRRVTALGEEMLRVVRQIQLGKTRREALRNMIDRIRHPDITAVMGSIVQADELGVSIGAILRIQAEQVRRKRFERAEKLAHEAPVKLLFPLVFFIFPSVFLVLLGPVVLQMFRQGI
jgi:tight adherence protein C